MHEKLEVSIKKQRTSKRTKKWILELKNKNKKEKPPRGTGTQIGEGRRRNQRSESWTIETIVSEEHCAHSLASHVCALWSPEEQRGRGERRFSEEILAEHVPDWRSAFHINVQEIQRPPRDSCKDTPRPNCKQRQNLQSSEREVAPPTQGSPSELSSRLLLEASGQERDPPAQEAKC